MKATLIDDLDSAYVWLSPLGRRIVSPIADQVRSHVLTLAERRDWSVIPHASFVKWTLDLPSQDDTWIIADKVFPTEALRGESIRVDLHRSWAGRGPSALEPHLVVGMDGLPEAVVPGTQLTLLDDCAYTGGTLRALLDHLAQRGAAVRRIALCVSRAPVLEECRARGVSAVCQDVVEAGADILHLRDFFPLVPFSGRRLHRKARLVCANGRTLELRLAPAMFHRGAWLHARGETSLHATIDWALEEAVGALTSHLGHPPQVADLALLGDAVSVPLCAPDQDVSEDTLLRALLLGRNDRAQE